MSVASIKLVTWNVTCKTCVIIRTALLTFVMGVWAFGESAGRAKAASELARYGYHKEARKLMLENK